MSQKVKDDFDVVSAKPEDFFKKREDVSRAVGAYYRLGEVLQSYPFFFWNKNVFSLETEKKEVDGVF